MEKTRFNYKRLLWLPGLFAWILTMSAEIPAGYYS